ncbi:MAG: hypothetical protein BWK80_34215 [Desulfobacteraceae bacterium IS3]|nr:MAG: hypothetical protein BWK80_34215 [Desulfobacteraceae bacterium IS3]
MFDFEKELLEIIEEREMVLFEIERTLFTKRYNLSRKHFEIFAVQSIAMIYSIWEGFIQQTFQLYITELNRKKLELQDFSDEIIIFHMENTFKQFKDYPQKEKRKTNFYSQLSLFFLTKNYTLYSQINTEDNLGFDILNKILKTFSLDPFTEHWKKYKHPNPNLKESLNTFLRYRNGVAHGGDISSEEKVTQEVYVKYKNLVRDLMYEIQLKMVTGLKDKTYLRDK